MKGRKISIIDLHFLFHATVIENDREKRSHPVVVTNMDQPPNPSNFRTERPPDCQKN